MSFRPVNFERLAKFNSAASSNLIDVYENHVDSIIASKNSEPKSRTFAPSSFRCPRLSWFRLRGVQPDAISSPDRSLDYISKLGTACHQIIQQTLIDALGCDWIEVDDYLKSINFPYKYSVEKDRYETKVHIADPPVKFACDGVIRLNGEMYLLEIKTSERGSFEDLTEPKSQHIDQIRFYASILHIGKVLVLYVDRQYGDLKCYEIRVTDSDNRYVWDRIKHVQEMVEANIAPEGLPKGDAWCTSNMCPYYRVCKQWG